MNIIDHVCDQICVGDHNLLCLCCAKILKFRQHLLRCAVKERCLLIRIGKALSCHNDAAVYLILRIQKMDITGCNNRLMILLSQSNNTAVDLHQIILILDLWIFVVIAQHKLIIAKRLDLQIIIEAHQTVDLFVGLSLENTTVQLSRLTGRAHDKTFLILQIQALRKLWTPVEILQM